MFERMMMQR